LAALAAGLPGCFLTQTEVVTARNSLKLCGRQFVHDDTAARERTVFRWDERRRRYIDGEGRTAVRFARLKGDAYVVQLQALKESQGEGRPARGAAKGYALLQARVAPPRLVVQSTGCPGGGADQEWRARGYGLEIDTNRGLLTGGREGILGFLVESLKCEPQTLDIVLLPDALAPGGPELATEGLTYDRGRWVPFLTRKCDTGDGESCYKLGQMYLKGDGVPGDPTRAAGLFEKVCAARDLRGCLDLGLLYDSGQGVPRDSARAMELLGQACGGGEMYACDMIKARGR
jgi:hypothetical protein